MKQKNKTRNTWKLPVVLICHVILLNPFLHPSPYIVFNLLFKIPRSVSIEIRLGKWNEKIHSALPHSSKIDCLLATDKEKSVRVEREQGEWKVGFQIRGGVSPLWAVDFLFEGYVYYIMFY